MTTANLRLAYQDLHPRLLRLAASIVGPDSAGDVVSRVYLRLSDVAENRVEHERAYLYRAVVNESVSFQRSLRRHRTRDARYLRLNPHASRSTTMQVRDLDVERALTKLSPQQRAVIHLTYWEDYTASTIADVMGVGEGSVKKQLARARKALRKELGYDAT